MRTTANQSTTRGTGWRWIAGIAAAFLVGLAVARIRATPLIPPLPPNALNVERKSSAEQQYIYAAIVNSEAAWKSVAAYFPDEKDRAWRLKAQQDLARLYLRDQDYPRALAIYQELTAQPDIDVQIRASGLAGEAFVLTMQGKFEESAGKLAELWPLRDSLRDPQARQMMMYILRRNQKALAGPVTDNWTRFLQPTLPGR